MDIWKKNMWICTAASFIVSIGMSQMAPIMPLYIEELGVTDADAIAMWAGIVFGCNFISLAIFSPIWGRLSDKYGRKPMMLRASAWLGLIMVGMGLAGNVWHLVILRLLQGALSGFQAAAIPLIAQETPSERSGWAMSIFFTGQVSGGLLGPVVGGWLSEIFGYRQTFFIIGAFFFMGFIALTQVKEHFVRPPEKEKRSITDIVRSLPQPSVVLGLFITIPIMHFSLTCTGPILTVYIDQLVPHTEHLALVAGIVFSCSGFASMLFASPLGKLADRRGPELVLLGSLLLAGLANIPQALVTTPLWLGVWRFVHGISIAGLLPAVNNLVKRLVPARDLGSFYGFSQSAQFIGMFTGAFAGGWLTGLIGMHMLFIATALLLIINGLWCYIAVVRPRHEAGLL